MSGADGPFPVLASETLLMSAFAFASAFGRHDGPAVVGLFVAAPVGSVLGDLLVFGLGRPSHRLLARTVDADCGLSSWVRRHLLWRAGVAIVGAALRARWAAAQHGDAGRFGLSLRRFLSWSIATSAAWTSYVLSVGMLLGPLTGGSTLLSLLAGLIMAVFTAGAFAVVARGRRRRRPWSVHVRAAEPALVG